MKPCKQVFLAITNKYTQSLTKRGWPTPIYDAYKKIDDVDDYCKVQALSGPLDLHRTCKLPAQTNNIKKIKGYFLEHIYLSTINNSTLKLVDKNQ